MRVKDIIRRIPLSSRIRLVYERITRTRFTTCYVLLILAACIVQTILHAFVLANNTSAKYYVGEIIEKAKEPVRYAYVKDNVLLVCDRLPLSGDPNACWPLTASMGNATTNDTTTNPSTYRSKRDAVLKRHEVTPEYINGVLEDVVVSSFAKPETTVTLSAQCVAALQWPDILLHEAMSEDVTLLAFQLWLFGMALMTVLNESIPHLFAALAGLTLSTGWSAFQIHRNHTFETLVRTLVTEDSCNGIDLLGSYWTKRRILFIPILTFGIVALIASTFLSYKLLRVFAQDSFNRVGADNKLNAMYKNILIFSMLLQLSVFFTISSSAMWVDELCTGAVKKVDGGDMQYIVIFSITCAMELPWLIIGWNAIRHESRGLTYLFFVVGTFLVVIWGAMFGSNIYRWTFQNSPFFATMTITAFLILVATLALALVCRLNFGKGLMEFLRMQQTFDHFEFETVQPDVKRVSVVVEKSSLDIERGDDEKRPSLDAGRGTPTSRPATKVFRLSKQLFGSSQTPDAEGKKNVNPYARAREMDKRHTVVVDIKKPPPTAGAGTAIKVSLPANPSPKAKRTLSSTSASTSISQVWSSMIASTTAPVPPVPAATSTTSSANGGVSRSNSQRSSAEFVRSTSSLGHFDSGDLEQQGEHQQLTTIQEQAARSTSSLPKLKTLQLPTAAGLSISPDPFRREGMKSGWY